MEKQLQYCCDVCNVKQYWILWIQSLDESITIMFVIITYDELDTNIYKTEQFYPIDDIIHDFNLIVTIMNIIGTLAHQCEILIAMYVITSEISLFTFIHNGDIIASPSHNDTLPDCFHYDYDNYSVFIWAKSCTVDSHTATGILVAANNNMWIDVTIEDGVFLTNSVINSSRTILSLT